MPFDLTLPALLFLAIGLATCGEAAAQARPDAQPPQEDAAPALDTRLGSGLAASRVAEPRDDARQDSLARAEAAEATEFAAPDAVAVPDAWPTAPVVYATGYGLQVTLPAGWDGPVTAQEVAFPRYALYTFDNARLDRAIPGARLRVERIGTLNPLDAERWRRGQSAYGLHGLRPVAPAATGALPAGTESALTVAGDGVRGLTAYARRGTTYWALQAVVPETVYEAAPGALVDLLRGVELPGGADPTSRAARLRR